MRSTVRFTLPPELEAAAPPEARGLRRDHVRLLLVDRATGSVEHHRFHELPRLLEPGDLVVANDSRTLPASLLGRTEAGTPLEVRLAVREPGGGAEGELAGGPGNPEGHPTGTGGERWAALPLGVPGDGSDPALVPTAARPPAPAARPGERLRFAGGLTATVLGRHEEAAPLVWLAFDLAGERLAQALYRAGRPVRYAYVPRPWPLRHYQTLFAAGPGSAEMASAGRPFSERVLVRLMARGVPVVPLTLHTGVSSPELHEPPYPERFTVPEVTARLVTSTRRAGRRVVAVGTTVTRALETATGEYGTTRPAGGWTDLVLGPDRPARAVTGLITGLHEPGASHLRLLEAVAGLELVDDAYREAVAERYLWHEFGDSMLFLP